MEQSAKLERIQARYDAGKMTKPIYEALIKKYGGAVAKGKKTQPEDFTKKGQRERYRAEEDLGVSRGPGAWGRK